ncbi:hypothetical protein DBV15_08756 [Temnothorax longispinosus]|uniref:Uncharacterized protein n=1 Tax=Temnothorax longispinosus TaxID=300112 RepID=A0A4S2KFA8_9HYME|nr:hypothetical protein DBV15_08756 [Temnothorax longispinosus]
MCVPCCRSAFSMRLDDNDDENDEDEEEEEEADEEEVADGRGWRYRRSAPDGVYDWNGGGG